MTLRRCVLSALVASASILSPAHALFNLNQGKDLIFTSATYGIGYDTNVFTRASGKSAFTQTASATIEYSRQAGLVGVAASLSAASGRFEGIRGQDFLDPNFSISLRKRYGRTTGSVSLSARRDSQPDPDIGQRTRAWNVSLGMDARYPVNDRYYLTNGLQTLTRQYGGASRGFTNLDSITDAIAINYQYTSKLDLNTGYTIGITDTEAHTKAYDHSWTVGASGSILPKLSGTINLGVQRRQSESTRGGREAFNSFTSGTSLRWMYSRRLSLSGDLSQSFSTSATDVSMNRASAGLHATGSISSRYIANAGIAYSISDFLGKAGAGRRDDMLQFDASIGLALTTHFKATFSYVCMLNYSNFAPADFERQTFSLALAANY